MTKENITTIIKSYPKQDNNAIVLRDSNGVPIEFRFDTHAFISFLEIIDSLSDKEDSFAGRIIDEIETHLPANTIEIDNLINSYKNGS